MNMKINESQLRKMIQESINEFLGFGRNRQQAQQPQQRQQQARLPQGFTPQSQDGPCWCWELSTSDLIKKYGTRYVYHRISSNTSVAALENLFFNATGDKIQDPSRVNDTFSSSNNSNSYNYSPDASNGGEEGGHGFRSSYDINESKLREIIKESIKKVLNERNNH